MTDSRYLALLRGINVGGNNLIRMTELKECFEHLGFTDISTYIQSGNVIFSAAGTHVEHLVDIIEKSLSERLSSTARAAVFTPEQLAEVIREAPDGFGRDPGMYRYDVLFLMGSISAQDVLKSIRTREGVDTAHAGKRVLYFSRLISQASRSYLSRIISLPVYQDMTIRNWNTTTRLLALLEKRPGG